MLYSKQSFFTSRDIKPTGWLKRQLEIQAEGLSGHLDEMWPSIRDSKWIGGDNEGWERFPYWLDGFIPLAYLLEDENMISRAEKYMDAIIANQEDDGWICPCSKDERRWYDIWAVYLICKVLTVYADCSGDKKAETAVYKTLKNLYERVRSESLFDWAAARWPECLVSICWLYEKYPEEWLLDMAYTLRIKGLNYEELYKGWRLAKPDIKWAYISHVVNIAMSIKSQALYSQLVEDYPLDMADMAYGLLMKDHGTAVGHFNGDEHLAGGSPIQGSELCSVVEAMYSYEWLLCITGESKWADRLESLAYNTLPATMSADMWTHQYDQMCNQMQCSTIPEEHNHFHSNSGGAHTFGLEPHYGCCTANFNQGWPKFVLSTFFKTKDGISIGAIAPAKLHTQINGVDVDFEIVTNYPFEDGYKLIIVPKKTVTFEISVRIPDNAKDVKIAGDADDAVSIDGSYRTYKKEWANSSEIDIRFEFDTVFVKRPNDMYCVQRGPLVFSLFIEDEWVKREYIKDGVERKFPYCDYEIYPKSPWSYAYSDDMPELYHGAIGSYIFDSKNPPVYMKARMFHIDWGKNYGVCNPVPKSRKPVGDAEEATLIPYGCSILRMTEMPVLKI